VGAAEQLALMALGPDAPPARPPGERTPAQLRAIAARGRDVFTEAGAGAGKTGVLVERYSDCVTEDGIAPDRILAFTFTERAAGELRERVHRLLAARARAAAERGEPELARDIARAARAGERSWITTIHGFCRRLCAAHPVAAGMDPRFRVLDEGEATRLGERAFDAALEESVAAGGDAAALFAAAFHPLRLRAMVQTAHERLRSQGVEPPTLPDPGDPVRSIKEGDEKAPLTPAEASLAKDGFASFWRLLDAYDRHYERLKAERSGADFEDLELRALALLTAAGPIRDSWRARFEQLMVDEFQDTNRVQLALIDALRGPETRLFCVGDEFQSIYRFRHADLEVFRERRQAASSERGTEEIPLHGNFRSRPDVLAALDFVGGTLFGDAFAPLEAGREAGGNPPGGRPSTELVLTDASEDGQDGGWRAGDVALEPPPGEGSPACVAEARFLALRLRELADAGVPRGDMVVLLRAFTHVDAYEEALERAGLSPYVVGGRGYWSQQQVEDALRLLAALANPLDDEMLFGALASPACGVSADALWLLRRAARDPEGRPRHVWPTIAEGAWGEAMPADDAARLERFRGTLATLRAEAPLLALDALIDRAISAFDYDLATLRLPKGERRMANLRKLMRLAAEYEEHEGRDLRGFLEFADERTRRDEREGMAAVQVEGHDGVRVMTVHAAKGLEFPVVAVADLGRGLGAGFRRPDVVIGRLRAEVGNPAGARFGMRLPVAGGESMRLWELVELCEEEEREEIEESLRLVYVAATRAQDRLILSGVFRSSALEGTDELRAWDTALHLLLPALADRGWSGDDAEVELPRAPAIGGGATAGPAPGLAIRVQRSSAERAARLRRRWPAPAPPRDPSAEPPSPLLPEPVAAAASGHLSYSALADYAGCGYRFYVERVLGLASPLDHETTTGGESHSADADLTADELISPELGPRRRALAIGNSVHAILETIARRSWAAPAPTEILGILVREGIADDPEARDRVEALVAGWLGSGLRGELERSATRLRPEVPFVLGLGDAVVRGKIDLLAQGDGGTWVVDYKTDALDSADPQELAKRYETQRDLYALAVAGAQLETPAPVIRAAHCFLEAPDRAVVETYDEAALEAAQARLEGLIARIRDGDFTRTPEPYPSLCYGCPAAARLCGKPAWRPGWARAAAR
jgi:ATP-dependent helicase/nuclease subunit A